MEKPRGCSDDWRTCQAEGTPGVCAELCDAHAREAERDKSADVKLSGDALRQYLEQAK